MDGGQARTAMRETASQGWDRSAPAGSEAQPRTGYLQAKRAFDVAMSATLLLLLSPLLAVIALLIKLDTSGPVIFSQERVGYDRRTGRQRTFIMYKFRSMYRNCDQSVHEKFIKDWIEHRIGSGNLTEHSPRLLKLTSDRRVTRVGDLLRKTSLDELPQLWNVLKGDMSLVGPRPVPTYEVAIYEPRHMRRLQATPGITGLWQVKARGRSDFEEMVSLDIQYLEQRSFWLDLRILVLTLPAVVSARGAA